MEAAETRSAYPGHLVALAGVVVAAFAVYALLARGVDAPRAFSDELLYLEVGASIADGDGTTIRGQDYQHATLYPYLLGGLLALVPDREDAYEAAKLLNALLVALVAVPIFLLARRLLGPWASVAVAGLAVAIPSAMYVSVVMTECIAYLAVAWALLAIVLALERPTWPRQLAVLLALGVAAAARTELIALFGAYLVALAIVMLVVPARRLRPRPLARTLAPTLVATLGGLVAFVVLPIARGAPPSSLGGYSTLWRWYDVTDVAHWLAYHLANLELYLAVVPLAVAPIVLVSLYRSARAGSERHAAFLALFLAVNSALLLLTSAFNSTIWAGDRLHDRPVFYIVPLWLVLLFVWLAEGAPRPFVAAAIGSVAVLVLPLLMPFPKFVRSEAASQFNGVGTTLWVEIDEVFARADLSGLLAALLFAIGLVVVTLLLPPRIRYVIPAIVLAVFVLAGAVTWQEARHVAAEWGSSLPAGERSWLDEQGLEPGSATLVTAIRACSPESAKQAAYLTDFFNDAVGDVGHFGQYPDLLPRDTVRLAEDGRLLADGEPLQADYVVAPAALRLAGRRLAEASTVPLVLWRVSEPVRVTETPVFFPGKC
jgi:Dolichyl-phosphate-mannose-protein mannosyltransferase